MEKINKTSNDSDIKNKYDYEIGEFFPIENIHPLSKTDQKIIDDFHILNCLKNSQVLNLS